MTDLIYITTRNRFCPKRALIVGFQGLAALGDESLRDAQADLTPDGGYRRTPRDADRC